MKGKLVIIICAFVMAIPLYSQDKEKKKEKVADDVRVDDKVYKEVTLENFESTIYDKKNFTFREGKDRKASIMIRSKYPAPIKNSKKYLGVKVYGSWGDVITIRPPKPLKIEKYCKNISLWVYGKNFSGELSLLVKDANGNSHRLIMGKLRFIGWRKLTVKISEDIPQQDKYLAQNRYMELIQIIYNPGNMARLPIWNYFYIDDILVTVRDKYVDKQTDEW